MVAAAGKWSQGINPTFAGKSVDSGNQYNEREEWGRHVDLP
jgi:hypothetical protein